MSGLQSSWALCWRMSTTQITACPPNLFVRNYLQLHHLSSTPCSLAISGKWLPRTDLMLTANASHHRRSMPVCLLGGKGNVEGGSGVRGFFSYCLFFYWVLEVLQIQILKLEEESPNMWGKIIDVHLRWMVSIFLAPPVYFYSYGGFLICLPIFVSWADFFCPMQRYHMQVLILGGLKIVLCNKFQPSVSWVCLFAFQLQLIEYDNDWC